MPSSMAIFLKGHLRREAPEVSWFFSRESHGDLDVRQCISFARSAISPVSSKVSISSLGIPDRARNCSTYHWPRISLHYATESVSADHGFYLF
jgi:hypothetical protein